MTVRLLTPGIVITPRKTSYAYRPPTRVYSSTKEQKGLVPTAACFRPARAALWAWRRHVACWLALSCGPPLMRRMQRVISSAGGRSLGVQASPRCQQPDHRPNPADVRQARGTNDTAIGNRHACRARFPVAVTAARSETCGVAPARSRLRAMHPAGALPHHQRRLSCPPASFACPPSSSAAATVVRACMPASAAACFRGRSRSGRGSPPGRSTRWRP